MEIHCGSELTYLIWSKMYFVFNTKRTNTDSKHGPGVSSFRPIMGCGWKCFECYLPRGHRRLSCFFCNLTKSNETTCSGHIDSAMRLLYSAEKNIKPVFWNIKNKKIYKLTPLYNSHYHDTKSWVSWEIRPVAISYFWYIIFVAKRIHCNNIIAVSMKKSCSTQSPCNS